MMNNFKFFSLVLFSSLFIVLSTSFGAEITLSQKELAERVLNESNQSSEINWRSELGKLASINAQAAFDYYLYADTSYENSKFEGFSSSSNLKDETLAAILGLKKPLQTGSILGVEYKRSSIKSEYSPYLSTTLPEARTQDIFGFTFEQALWRNSFGASDRANLKSAILSYESSRLSKGDELESLVLDSIRLFWRTYVAQENFRESLASRDRYAKLVDVVKRKSGLGYANPGELANIRAEYEQKNINVKNESNNYLLNLDQLVTLLKLPPGTEVKFSVPDQIPNIPELADLKVEDLRSVKSSKLRVQASDELINVAKAKGWPDLSLTAKYYAAGLEETPQDAYSEMASQTHPKYFVGLKFQYTFGTDSTSEEIRNKTYSKLIEESLLNRKILELKDGETLAKRKAQASYAIALSALEQKKLREQAMNELTKSYNQGRTDLQVLIDAMNRFYASEIQFSKSVGDYQIALNEWAATRDELIPENNTSNKESR